ncbi:hypothetical protein [uncultured Pseudoteredinibacter sp.]|uniref:hypothetical protein n=1 Tax=uncultured Pseudoteredinibacter sp. TaxID=1641701 RepID=UPI00261BF66D|nr:hypothetical protein [uncultured Pseudoteredinibacter sp.]
MNNHVCLIRRFTRAFKRVFLAAGFGIILASPALSNSSLSCHYSLSNWDDNTARQALEQWPTSSEQFILVLNGQVDAQLPPQQCKQLQQWLRKHEAQSSGYTMRLYYGKHPNKQLKAAAQGKHSQVRHKTISTDKSNGRYKGLSLALSPGQEVLISPRSWHQSPKGLSQQTIQASNVHIAQKQDQNSIKNKIATHRTAYNEERSALSRKLPKQNEQWLAIETELKNPVSFGFTLFAKESSGPTLRVSQHYWDESSQQWLEQFKRSQSIKLKQWYNLDQLLFKSDSPVNGERKFSTQSKSEHSRYFIYIDKP